ncbi:hypothetical protein SLEP1_g50780 [Rubroshorea leprosula]|uniref:Uncharacterized protein n=1 Tax=Rubroshorea leprosula TaxID=152421 RepID=A0AAV5M4B6_9ROSI|nr:hypothetical protein SLEP1_g50780 [Rubroshorea leprosula]
MDKMRIWMRGQERDRRSRGKWRSQEQRYERNGEQLVHQGRGRQFQLDRRVDCGVHKQSVPFFFTNFPKDWNYEQMWDCQGSGDNPIPSRSVLYGSTYQTKRFDVARVLISTSYSEVISKIMKVKINGEFYNIKCVEEEAPLNIFSMKSDYIINNPIDKEHSSDYWGQSSSAEGQSFFGDEGRFSVLSCKEVGDQEDMGDAQGLELEEAKSLNSNCSIGVKGSRSITSLANDGIARKTI